MTEESNRSIEGPRLPSPWQAMEDAPKDGRPILVILAGSDIPCPVRWVDRLAIRPNQLPGWYTTWDNYLIPDIDGPLYWMHCPPVGKAVVILKDLQAPPEPGFKPGDLIRIRRTHSTSVLLEILDERYRQITMEGFTPERDDQSYYEGDGSLAMAAACYAGNAGGYVWQGGAPNENVWPFSLRWWRPTTPRRDLVKAAALILAAIEQIDRYKRSGEVRGDEP